MESWDRIGLHGSLLGRSSNLYLNNSKSVGLLGKLQINNLVSTRLPCVHLLVPTSVSMKQLESQENSESLHVCYMPQAPSKGLLPLALGYLHPAFQAKAQRTTITSHIITIIVASTFLTELVCIGIRNTDMHHKMRITSTGWMWLLETTRWRQRHGCRW